MATQCRHCRRRDGDVYRRSRVGHGVQWLSRPQPATTYWLPTETLQIGADGLCEFCREKLAAGTCDAAG